MNTEDQRVWFRFVLAVLATWRVTHLLAREDGPADVIYRGRRLLGSSILGKLADCFQCLSLWVAAPFCFFVTAGGIERAVTWLALSGAACLLERLNLHGGTPPVVIQNLENQEESQDALLWTESGELTSEPAGGGPAVPSNHSRTGNGAAGG
jgi:hypothetical protein